ncbi:fluoride efflux transporter CrcB [Rhodobacteraceae bacterium NNCM2]|nr:fluoride efflux transporter CrcB [Coraliihabitans acroporae]
MIDKIALVAAGGALGSTLRFLVGHWTLRTLGPVFPWGTFAVNVAGSFAMGVIAVVLMERFPGSFARWSPFVMTGVLGGFTTFSAFSLDAILLMERGKTDLALAYIAGSVCLSIGALWAGFVLARAL